MRTSTSFGVNLNSAPYRFPFDTPVPLTKLPEDGELRDSFFSLVRLQMITYELVG
jgi:hypothetical protein